MCVRRARGRVLGNGEGTFPGQGNVSWATLRLKMLKFKHSVDFRWNLILLSFVLSFQFVFHIVCARKARGPFLGDGEGTFPGQGNVSWATLRLKCWNSNISCLISYEICFCYHLFWVSSLFYILRVYTGQGDVSWAMAGGTFSGQGNVSWATLRLKMLKFKHIGDCMWNLICLSFVFSFGWFFHPMCVGKARGHFFWVLNQQLPTGKAPPIGLKWMCQGRHV